MCLSIVFIYCIWYWDWASLHSTASEHQCIYHLLHFSWPAHIDEAYSKVLNNVLVENSIYSCQYNFEKADWKNLIKDISTEQNNEEFSWSLKRLSAESLEFEAETFQKLIINLVEKHIFRKNAISF